jgi:putative signal transducing protein
MADTLRSVRAVSSEAEAELIRERLEEVGIQAILQRTIGGPEWGASGARSVMVEEADLERARALLAAEEGSFSDEELTRLSEQAGGAEEG